MKVSRLSILMIISAVIPLASTQPQSSNIQAAGTGLVPGAGVVIIEAPSGATITTNSTSWTKMPHMDGAVMVDEMSEAALTFCAEVNVTNGDTLRVRAILGGFLTSPSEVILAVGATVDTRCFTFVRNGLPAGAHSIQIEWRVDNGNVAEIGDRTLSIAYAHANGNDMRVLAVAAPTGSEAAASGAWSDIPNMAGSIQLSDASDLSISFSAEALTSNGSSLFIRALVDGQVASPSDEILVVEGFQGTRLFHFIKTGAAAGTHDVRIQWLLSGSGAGSAGDRTLAVIGIRQSGAESASRLMVAAPSGADQSTTSTSWVNIPNLNGSLNAPQGGDLVAEFSAEIWASPGKRVFLRALVDGQPSEPGDVRLFSGGWRGTYAFTFVLMDIEAGNHSVQLQWYVDPGGQASIGDRTLVAYTFAKPYPASWSPLPVLDSYTVAAISGHNDGRLYAAAITFDGHMYSTSTTSPRGWAAWESVGPAHNCPSQPCIDPAYHFEPNTQPVLLFRKYATGAAIVLFARGIDNNIYFAAKGAGTNSSTPWTEWRQLTTGGRVRGRISVAYTVSLPEGAIYHILYASEANTVEYRPFGGDFAQVGPTQVWTDAMEGTIASDGVNEVWSAIKSTYPAILIEKKQRPWSSPWQPAAMRTAGGAQGQFFDISNLVYFSGAYHVAYSYKYLCGGSYCQAFAHSRFRAGLNDDGHVQVLFMYTPQGSDHPQAELAIYRNKLVMAYKDENGWIRYARWDNADPFSPWVGNSIVSNGRSSHRPALAALDRRARLTTNADYIVPNFGNELFAVVNGFSDDRLWFTDFSRAIFIQELDPQFDIYLSHSDDYILDGRPYICVDQDHLLAATKITRLSKEGRPFLSELGYNLWVLPDWLSGHIFKDAGRMGVEEGNTSGRFEPPAELAKYPVIITKGHIGQCSGSWLPQQGDYRRAWEELGHGILHGPFGYHDEENSKPPGGENADVTGIPLPALQQGFEIFGRFTNIQQNCQAGAASDGRCRGFTGVAGNYDAGTRQHSFMYVHHYYSVGEGKRLREMAQDDTANGQPLLQEKIDWGKEHIFHGLEFNDGAEPLLPLLNDEFWTATWIFSAPFRWTEDTTMASSHPSDPLIACGNNQQHRKSVWFTYTPPSSRTITLDTSGSDYDTVLAAWSGNWGALSLVACHDDVDGSDRTSLLRLPVTAGVTIYFEVTAYGYGTGGRLEFQIQPDRLFLPLLKR